MYEQLTGRPCPLSLAYGLAKGSVTDSTFFVGYIAAAIFAYRN